MTAKTPSLPMMPLTTEQLSAIDTAISTLSPQQRVWLSGYLWGQLAAQQNTQPTIAAPAASPAITILSASQTGNARRLAEQLHSDLLAGGISATLVAAKEYPFKKLAQERWLIVVISTQGEGEPPEEAIALCNYLFSKRVSTLNQLAFAVFALGDSSYEHFCLAGRRFDQRLAELGARRLLERQDADVDYQQQASAWRQQLLELLTAQHAASKAPTIEVAQPTVAADSYSRERPFNAELLVKQKITGRRSVKDIRHLELDLSGSGLCYQPGDSLGVWYENDPALVEELLTLLELDGQQQIQVGEHTFPLAEALCRDYELTQNTATMVTRYAGLTALTALKPLLADKAALQRYAHHTPLVDMLRHYPASLTAEQLQGVLRPLTPRLYSIASSQAEVGDEVHITLGVVRYQVDGYARTGGASGYLADRLQPEDKVRVFIETNDHFRLPVDDSLPIIMIGPGTGIAPYRAFMQQRAASGAQGNNWLLFGNPHFTEDFLYQTEWQRYLKQGLLTRIDLAWSRDQAEKVYVQHKLLEHGRELWHWLQQGAHLYVCGDAVHMAKAVEQALLEVIGIHGGMQPEQATEYLSDLRLTSRYQRDIY